MTEQQHTLIRVQLPDGTITQKRYVDLQPDDQVVIDGPGAFAGIEAAQARLDAEINAAGGLDAWRRQSIEKQLPPLPDEKALGNCIPYADIRYVAGYSIWQVQKYAKAYAVEAVLHAFQHCAQLHPALIAPPPEVVPRVYCRPECMYRYCPNPEACKAAGKCESPNNAPLPPFPSPEMKA